MSLRPSDLEHAVKLIEGGDTAEAAAHLEALADELMTDDDEPSGPDLVQLEYALRDIEDMAARLRRHWELEPDLGRVDSLRPLIQELEGALGHIAWEFNT